MIKEKDYFTCDYCHRVGTGITIVNGFKMCPMCLAEYQHKSGENNKLREELGIKHKEVEQLKHDLAVRDKALELSLKDVIRYPVQLCMKEYWLEQAEKELKGEK